MSLDKRKKKKAAKRHKDGLFKDGQLVFTANDTARASGEWQNKISVHLKRARGCKKHIWTANNSDRDGEKRISRSQNVFA